MEMMKKGMEGIEKKQSSQSHAQKHDLTKK